MNQTLISETPEISWRDYWQLCKPKVVALMIVTSVVGMLLASPTLPSLSVLILGNLGIALCAFSAAAVNHVVDRHIDILMARTQRRPIAAGRINPRNAIAFALVLGFLGMAILMVFINALTAWLSLATLMGYAVLYTLYLKRATPQNIVIGGAAGAAPPLLGWAAVTNTVDPYALLLVLIIFTWTPPHFWALAIYRRKEYEKAEIPMLSVTHGIRFTKLCVLLYTLLLVVVTALPYITGMSGIVYLISAMLLDAIFLYYALKLWMSEDMRVAIRTFLYSIFYLFLLFAALLVDHYIA